MGALILKEPYVEKRVEYELAFGDGFGNGYSFPCDKDGNLTCKYEEAIINYHKCMAHPEDFKRFNYLDEIVTTIRHGATIRCTCGKEMELYDEYCGACECDNCHQWYNMFGQRLVDPEFWESDDD